MEDRTQRLVSRRWALRLLGSGAAASLLAACAPAAGPSPTSAPAKPAESKPSEAAKPAAPAAAAKPTASPAAAAATQAAPAAAAPTETLRLGAAVALTGGVSKEGNLVKDGYEVWQQFVNDKGGLQVGGKRYKVELKLYDDESKADTATRLTEKLITEDKVQFILGPFSSGITQATSTISERYQILTINPQANADGIYERGYKYIFSILPPASSYLRGLIDLAATFSPKPEKVAVMIRDDPFGNFAGEGAAKYAQEKGFNIVFKEKYPANATDVSSILTQVKNANPDILLASTLFQDSVLITKQAKDLQFSPKLTGFTAGPALPDFISSLGKDADYVFGSEWWLPTLKYDCVLFGSAQQYAQTFQQAKNYLPFYHAASGSAAGLILQLALEKAGTLETEPVRTALLGLEPKTFWGPIGWNEQGKNVKGTTIPAQIQDGKLLAVWPADAREAQPKYPTPAWNQR
jgi:branched-chain amino acid transport system substrate-binding protein